MMMRIPVALLEQAALNAVPAPRLRFDGPFLQRAFHGGTGRANAACSLHPACDPDLPARIGRIESRYRAWGLPPRIRSTPLDPPRLVPLLRDAGWREEDETLVLCGDLRAMAGAEPAARLLLAPEPAWMAVVATAEHQSPARQREKREGAALMAIPCAWVLLEDAASLFVTADGPLCGMFDLAVRPEARRRGLARRVMGAAAAWGLAQGCTVKWSQVSAANAASLALNAGLGMRESHRYRYFVRR
jgi:GNAT superfamily N-acetyltransferase